MKIVVLASILALLSRSMVDAQAWATTTVECSKIQETTDSSFRACATTSFSEPSPVMNAEGQEEFVGGYFSEFKVTTGLKKGTEVSALSENERKKAYKNGITVLVALDDDNECTVTVNVKDKSSECKACKHCGNQKFTVDCTNVANGRKTKCESAKGSQTTGKSRVFFPLTKTALSPTKMRLRQK